MIAMTTCIYQWEEIMKISNVRIGIGLALGVASVATLFGRTIGRGSLRSRKGALEGEYTHGGHIPAPQGKEKVEVKEMGGIP
jgi:hypothetical protein